MNALTGYNIPTFGEQRFAIRGFKDSVMVVVELGFMTRSDFDSIMAFSMKLLKIGVLYVGKAISLHGITGITTVCKHTGKGLKVIYNTEQQLHSFIVRNTIPHSSFTG
jgi:hypothetical protein